MLTKKIKVAILLIVVSLTSLTACSMFDKRANVSLEVKCPPETGGDIYHLPELLTV